MKKRIVGIYSSYDASEQTLCAEFLAGYVVKCYRHVKWFVPKAPKPGDRFYGFSHQWDSEVISCHEKSDLVRKNAASCDTFFFFAPNDELRDALSPKAVTACIVDPRKPATFEKRCTLVLVPSESWLSWRHSDPSRNVLVWPYDPSMQCIPRNDLDYEKEPRLFFPAFGLNDLQRRFIRRVAEIVKRCQPNVRTVVGYYDARIPPSPGNDSRTHDWRLIRYLQNSDWIIDLNPQPQYGLFAACAGGYGLQWAGFDVPPNSDAWNASRRHLIRESLVRTGGSERVMPDLESTVAQIVARLDRPFPSLEERHHSCGVWDGRRAEYLRVTNIVLGFKPER
jgi:hypothetical protein